MLLKTKFTNQLKAEALKRNMRVDFFLRNISVNGEKRGCSGHIVNKENGVCVYVNTEGTDYISSTDSLKKIVMYRFAKDAADFSSNSLKHGYNRWCSENKLAASVMELLEREDLYL